MAQETSSVSWAFIQMMRVDSVDSYEWNKKEKKNLPHVVVPSRKRTTRLSVNIKKV